MTINLIAAALKLINSQHLICLLISFISFVACLTVCVSRIYFFIISSLSLIMRSYMSSCGSYVAACPPAVSRWRPNWPVSWGRNEVLTELLDGRCRQRGTQTGLKVWSGLISPVHWAREQPNNSSGWTSTSLVLRNKNQMRPIQVKHS